MQQPRVFITFILAWFFSWGFVLLKFPRQCHRLLSFGKEPSPRNLKLAKMVGWMGLFFGAVAVIELVFGIIKTR